MRRNSCWFTSPSPSLSASSIISFKTSVITSVRTFAAWTEFTECCIWAEIINVYKLLYLQFFVCEVFSQLFGDSFKILEWDRSFLFRHHQRVGRLSGFPLWSPFQPKMDSERCHVWVKHTVVQLHFSIQLDVEYTWQMYFHVFHKANVNIVYIHLHGGILNVYIKM